MELDAAAIVESINKGINPDVIGAISSNRKFALVYKGEIVAQGSRYDKAYQKVLQDLKKASSDPNKIIEVLENLLNPVGKVGYGETKLGRLAIEFRKTLPVPSHNGNIAIFEFIGKNGRLETKAFTTLTQEELNVLGYIRKKPHAEELGFDWLKEQRIASDKVKSIYSELEPCMLGDHKCKEQIAETFPEAKVSYFYSLTKHPQVMKKAITDRARDLTTLIKK